MRGQRRWRSGEWRGRGRLCAVDCPLRHAALTAPQQRQQRQPVVWGRCTSNHQGYAMRPTPGRAGCWEDGLPAQASRVNGAVWRRATGTGGLCESTVHLRASPPPKLAKTKLSRYKWCTPAGATAQAITRLSSLVSLPPRVPLSHRRRSPATSSLNHRRVALPCRRRGRKRKLRGPHTTAASEHSVSKGGWRVDGGSFTTAGRVGACTLCGRYGVKVPPLLAGCDSSSARGSSCCTVRGA